MDYDYFFYSHYLQQNEPQDAYRGGNTKMISQRIYRAMAILIALALLATPALADDKRYAPENMPNFNYPTERDPIPYFPQGAPDWPSPKLGDGPFELQSFEQRDYRVVVLARGFSQPRTLAFMPNGDILITEKAGRLRIVRNGIMAPDPVPGTPEVISRGTMAGLMDIALHPDFADNGWIYISYHKPVYGNFGANSIWRGRWTGNAIEDGRDIFVADDVDMEVSRIEFGSDGKLYMTIGSAAWGPEESMIRTQHGDDFSGKTIRLNDDGSVPADNPFVNTDGMNPEIFSLGHRNQLGLAVNPETGAMWASDQGPNGGDEVNVLRPGLNYGWPLVNDGRDYLGPYQSDYLCLEGMVRPEIAFNPSPALTGMVFYTGDRFPAWKNNLFIGALRFGEIPRTGHLLRIVFNENWQELRREMLLVELHQRIRDIVQGPDLLLYVITAEDDAALLRLEPVTAQTD
jgi:glucose/arabinose dehydrogenase